MHWLVEAYPLAGPINLKLQKSSPIRSSTLADCCSLLVAGAEDTIITWTDSDIGVDVALSFQEVGGCTSVWWAHRALHHLTPCLVAHRCCIGRAPQKDAAALGAQLHLSANHTS